MTQINLPPMVAHPDPHAFNWSTAEIRAIKAYATAAVLADRAAAQPASAERNRVIEMCAAAIEPQYKRPCDCTTCDCGNAGNTQDVAAWDASTVDAAMLRAWKETT